MTAAELDIIVGANVNEAIAAFNKLGYTITKTEQAATKMTQKSGKDFTGLSRIIQDLPFGFVAISNNLTQLLPAAGAAGLAISALVSVITFASTGFANWTRGLTGNKEALEDNAKAVKELDANAGKEIAHLTTLTNAAKDTNLSMNERLAAVKLLRQEFPSYFKDLQTEKILNGEVAAAIQATSNAIFQRAVVRQKESQLSPIAGQLFDLRQQREELVKQEAALKRLSAIAGQTRSRQGVVSSLLGAGSQDKNTLAKVTQQIAELDQQIAPLQGQFKTLAQAIIDASEAAGKGIFTELVKDKDAAKRSFGADKFQWLIPDFNFQVIPKLSEKMLTLQEQLQGRLDIKPLLLRFELPDLSKGLELQKQLDLINGIIRDGLAEMGQAIGNAFSGKGNIFGAFLNILGASLVKLGTYVLASVELLTNIRVALIQALSSTPALGIAVGVGLIALGTVLKNIPKFATGGVVTKPTLIMAGEQGPERITPLGYEGSANNMWGSGEVVFQISGQNLRGILRRADQTAFNTF